MIANAGRIPGKIDRLNSGFERPTPTGADPSASRLRAYAEENGKSPRGLGCCAGQAIISAPPWQGRSRCFPRSRRRAHPAVPPEAGTRWPAAADSPPAVPAGRSGELMPPGRAPAFGARNGDPAVIETAADIL
jgi:hypothetical protein